MRLIPEKTERDVADMRKKLEILEAEKEEEDGKLKQVLDSLKSETQVRCCVTTIVYMYSLVVDQSDSRVMVCFCVQVFQNEKDELEQKLMGLKKVADDAKSQVRVAIVGRQDCSITSRLYLCVCS